MGNLMDQKKNEKKNDESQGKTTFFVKNFLFFKEFQMILQRISVCNPILRQIWNFIGNEKFKFKIFFLLKMIGKSFSFFTLHLYCWFIIPIQETIFIIDKNFLSFWLFVLFCFSIRHWMINILEWIFWMLFKWLNRMIDRSYTYGNKL